MSFTKEQLDWYKAYEQVRQSGEFNMITEAGNAMKKAGLDKNQYVFVIEHFSELRETVEEQ